jgi:hypothetical protein
MRSSELLVPGDARQILQRRLRSDGENPRYRLPLQSSRLQRKSALERGFGRQALGWELGVFCHSPITLPQGVVSRETTAKDVFIVKGGLRGDGRE